MNEKYLKTVLKKLQQDDEKITLTGDYNGSYTYSIILEKVSELTAKFVFSHFTISKRNLMVMKSNTELVFWINTNISLLRKQCEEQILELEQEYYDAHRTNNQEPTIANQIWDDPITTVYYNDRIRIDKSILYGPWTGLDFGTPPDQSSQSDQWEDDGGAITKNT